MWVDAGWRGGVAQCELAKKLAQDWSRRKKLTTAAVCADHVGAWFLVLFENRKDRTLPALACATANQSATTGDADHDKHGEPTQINETTRNPRWTTPKPKKNKRETRKYSAVACSQQTRAPWDSQQHVAILIIYIYTLLRPLLDSSSAPKRRHRERHVLQNAFRSQKKTTTEETYNPWPWNPWEWQEKLQQNAAAKNKKELQS